jgi:hypothetical protein
LLKEVDRSHAIYNAERNKKEKRREFRRLMSMKGNQRLKILENGSSSNKIF